MEESNTKYVIKPKFSLLYELIMPTGRKIKSSLLVSFSMLLLYLIFNVLKGNVDFSQILNGIDVFPILNIIFIVLFIVFFIKMIIHISFQILQYKYLTFSFFDDYMIYEDSFLNQHRKTIKYSNIKEVEIRRTITDRILGYGIIVIYTNAENSNNGLVIYSIKKPQECYNIIQNIINESKDNNYLKTNNINNDYDLENKEIDESNIQELSKIVNLSREEEEKFNESLKNINNE